jgi:2-polyprenyl-3-methyl-5-hydroxy-6-metoxy-1,4-benzoquinol methylase
MAWINRYLLGTRSLIRRAILEDIRRRPGRPPYTILDVGAGGCDIALWLARSRRDLRITCLDHDPRVVDYARRACAGEPAIEVHLGSAADIAGLPAYDFVFANLFLHHLEDGQVGSTLTAMLGRTRRLLLVSDLLRSRRSHFWYGLFAGLFLHGSFAAADGRLSIRRGFRPEELRALLDGAADRVEVRREAPGRVCLIGRP